MSWKKLGITAASVAAAGGLAFGAATLATAASSPTSSSSSGAQSGEQGAGDQKSGRGGGMGWHTEVTGEEATRVGDAVTAKDSAFTVEKVLKDEDGSYDVLGTKNNQPARYQVSTDLKTITEDTHGPRGMGGRGMGGPGEHGDHQNSQQDSGQQETGQEQGS